MPVRGSKAHWAQLLQCPVCRSDMAFRHDAVACVNAGCQNHDGVPLQDGQPVLLGRDSIVDMDTVRALSECAPSRRGQLRNTLWRRAYAGLTCSNFVAPENADAFLSLCRTGGDKARILVIGGGTRGQGADALWRDANVELISFDIYASENTDFVADAHTVPLKDGAVDGVWIQAVLEHVIDPWKVVAEIWRVLGKDGVVYAETPFMQQVHEGAFDFFRFSHSGHRWLFRNFREIKSGKVAGAGVAANWALRYLVRALTGSTLAARLAGLCFFWLKFLDRAGKARLQLDAASGVFFLGRKSDQAMPAPELIGYYKL